MGGLVDASSYPTRRMIRIAPRWRSSSPGSSRSANIWLPFLNDKGVLVGSKSKSQEFKEHQETLAATMKDVGNVVASPMCMEHYGLKKEDLLDGIQVGSSGGWLYLFLINRFCSSGLIGAAFGGDAQDALIGVDRTPPPLPMVQQARIDVVNLDGVDDKAIFESAQDIYQSVLANEAEEGGFCDWDKIWKLLSDALYHNAYMRDETVITTVATFFGSRSLREG
jgi:hypothetical protein